MNKTFIIIFLLNIPLSYSFELFTAVPFDGGKASRTEEQKHATYVVYDAIEQANENVFSILSATNLDAGNQWLALSRDAEVHAVNVETKQYLGNWPLMMPAPILAGEQYAAAQQWHMLSNPPYRDEPDPLYVYVASETPDALIELPSTLTDILVENHRASQFGCLEKQPLRYGDINGMKTLVAIVRENIILSSPSLKKPIFRLIYAREDETLAEFVSDIHPNKAGTDPQFISESGMANNVGRFYPAQRSYGKIVTGDFNQDQKQDLVMWRKAYVSRLESDPVKGYALNAEILVHYEMQGGGYIQQTTQSEVVKSWLTSKNLTWQNGFPSKSECAGQEGQLIPEMHDPLLNDPDVLK